MSAPKIIVQILVTGAQIFGKALFEAGRQAVKNAKHSPQGAIASDAAGVRNATSGSATDKLTREHRMTLDEAHLILNVKRGEALENVLKNYEHLFKVNSPRPPPEAPKAGARAGKQPAPPAHSHYLQSKVIRAKERIEAELKVAVEEDTGAPGSGTSATSGPGPTSSSSPGPGTGGRAS
ncbi:protein transporter [Leucogyrophana mollusca]|uniref:Protein transporter n=1 Tax=Leucogyrophana mollusca TaxID=85980 RepID=A0ACB8BJH0_9AGAM|nr:protein transporter [Leucogyrophana mollusca]